MSTPEVSVFEEAVEAAARAIRGRLSSDPDGERRLLGAWDEGLTSPDDVRLATRQATAALTAALPVLRAEWEKPLRELVDDPWQIEQPWVLKSQVRAFLDALPGGER